MKESLRMDEEADAQSLDRNDDDSDQSSEKALLGLIRRTDNQTYEYIYGSREKELDQLLLKNTQTRSNEDKGSS